MPRFAIEIHKTKKRKDMIQFEIDVGSEEDAVEWAKRQIKQKGWSGTVFKTEIRELEVEAEA